MSVYRSRWKWGFLFLMLAVGCGPGINQTEVMPVCTPTGDNPNPYRNPDKTAAYLIYQSSLFFPIPVPGAATSDNPIPVTGKMADPSAQQKAFDLLESQVRSWSDYTDVLVHNNLIVRITVTYISPELIESVVLNQVFYSGVPVSDFPSAVKERKDAVAKRDELLFLVTVTASEYQIKLLPNDALIVDIPISEMKLTNSAGLPLSPYHADQNIEDEINIRAGPEHGYIAYPIAVQKDGICNWVMDPLWNTTMTLHIPDLLINRESHGLLTWSIDYHTLVETNAPINDQNSINDLMLLVVDPSVPSVPTSAPASQSKDPPLPINGVEKANNDYWNNYWEQMSRFIWYHLTNSIHP